jgi:hypothetical protein
LIDMARASMEKNGVEGEVLRPVDYDIATLALLSYFSPTSATRPPGRESAHLQHDPGWIIWGCVSMTWMRPRPNSSAVAHR